MDDEEEDEEDVGVADVVVLEILLGANDDSLVVKDVGTSETRDDGMVIDEVL